MMNQSAPPTLLVHCHLSPRMGVTISGRTSSTMLPRCARSGSKQKLSPQDPIAVWSQSWFEPQPIRLSWEWVTAGRPPQWP